MKYYRDFCVRWTETGDAIVGPRVYSNSGSWLSARSLAVHASLTHYLPVLVLPKESRGNRLPPAGRAIRRFCR